MDWSKAHIAVENEDLVALTAALADSGDIDDPTDDGMTLLHHAIDIEADGAAQTGQPLGVAMTRFLVEQGADLDWRWNDETPLEAARSRGHYLAVDVIRAAGSGAESPSE